jgi:hypothetical protein
LEYAKKIKDKNNMKCPLSKDIEDEHGESIGDALTIYTT